MEARKLMTDSFGRLAERAMDVPKKFNLLISPNSIKRPETNKDKNMIIKMRGA